VTTIHRRSYHWCPPAESHYPKRNAYQESTRKNGDKISGG